MASGKARKYPGTGKVLLAIVFLTILLNLLGSQLFNELNDRRGRANLDAAKCTLPDSRTAVLDPKKTQMCAADSDCVLVPVSQEYWCKGQFQAMNRDYVCNEKKQYALIAPENPPSSPPHASPSPEPVQFRTTSRYFTCAEAMSDIHLPNAPEAVKNFLLEPACVNGRCQAK